MKIKQTYYKDHLIIGPYGDNKFDIIKDITTIDEGFESLKDCKESIDLLTYRPFNNDTKWRTIMIKNRNECRTAEKLIWDNLVLEDGKFIGMENITKSLAVTLIYFLREIAQEEK